MSNSFKKIDNIIKEVNNINEYLIDAQKYYAHIPAWSSINSKPELLHEHIGLVLSYFKQLVQIHNIDDVVDNLIIDLLSEHNIKDNYSGDFIKTLFVNTIVYHDFGKINENFQANSDKMNNAYFKGQENLTSPIGTNHSSLSAFIFICKYLNEVEQIFPKSQRGFGNISVLLFSYPIFKHHSRQFNDDCTNEINFRDENIVMFLKKYLDSYNLDVNPNIIKFLSNTENFFEHPAINKYINSFNYYSLIRLNYSLLTASDYLATNEYMNNLTIKDFGILTSKRIDEIFEFISQNEWINKTENKKNYNKEVYQNLSLEIKVNPINESSGANLNVLRKKMAVEVINNVRQNYQNNLFYIEAPTGGGKTNLSLLATVELLKKYEGKLNKVFYVFPFTTLITQTYKSITETFCIREDEIIELHSKASIKTNRNEDDDYGRYKRNFIDNLFVNYPFCLLTHIKFFELLKTNEKEPNYLLHRLANSIIVIDELQSYNPKHWDKVIYFIKKYAYAYNIKFILMSATLPKLDKLEVIKNEVNDFVYLLPNAKNDYFRNSYFSKRVLFNFDLLYKKDISLQEIANLLYSESKIYSKKDFGKNKPQGSVYTIIEFIFKKTATDFYQIIKEQNTFFDNVLLLSGTILEHRRKEIINFLKNKTNRNKKVLLITTQVVETGVDIDMDLGFKDTSLIDSDEQLAGRINRNINKKECKLFLFSYNKEAQIYGEDKRLELTRKNISIELYKHILEEKDFDFLYDLVLNERNNWNSGNMTIGFPEYENKINTLQFESVNKDFQLIEQKNISCFIPIEIPIYVNGITDNTSDQIFSENDLTFLKANGISPNKYEKIYGEQVFNLYIDIINNKNITYFERQLKVKTLYGIMSKFVFSLFASPKIEKQITIFSDIEKNIYGYIYLSRWDEFYDINFGMNDASFNSNETQFL
ncbi:MAG: CRISPR-associated helicase Cas3' [Fermentimonas sp.]|nr:CRISPR-associated helicase Cas3' [Fermentimonas sp.]